MTIRLRLALIYVGAIALTMGLVSVLVWWQLGAALRSALDQTLVTRAAGVAAAIENEGSAGLQEGDAGAAPGIFVVVVDRSGVVLDATADVPAGFASPPPDARAADVAMGPTTYATRSVVGEGGTRVLAGSSLAPIEATLDRLARSLAFVASIAAVASLAGGWWLAGRALRPVALITAEASQISAADIERRLPVPARADEMRALATTLNGMLDRVGEALRRQRAFVAAASHDLRTPIATLRAELELAQDPGTTESELRAAIRSAHADAVRLGELTTGLLDLAAADADGRALVRRPIRADQLITAVVRRLEPVVRQREARVTVSAPARVVRVDRVRLEQALTNLVVNAVAYGPTRGEVQIVAGIDTRPSSASSGAGSVMTIEVLDQGPGIPPDFMDRLFVPFQRGPNATGLGTGLGLATAAAAIDAHHGTIGADARPGGGTCFWLTVPV